MTTNRVDVIDRSVEKTYIWLGDLAAELGSDDRRYAYRVLRAFLAGETEASIAAAPANRVLRRQVSTGEADSVLHELARHPRDPLMPEPMLDDG